MKGRGLIPAIGPILLLLARPASSQPIAKHPENPPPLPKAAAGRGH